MSLSFPNIPVTTPTSIPKETYKLMYVPTVPPTVPKKIKQGVYVQTYMTMAMKALTTAFLKWQEQQLQLEALGKQSTWQMYRRKLKVLNRNKLIVFVGQHFGIFPSHEVFMLANVCNGQVKSDTQFRLCCLQ